MDEGFVASNTVVLPAQFELNFTGAEMVLVMLGFPTACINNV